MNIIQRNPKELKHYKLNAKKHPDSQITGLAESIKRFGFIQPVVVDKDDQIIIGHGRTMAALRAGLETVPTVKLETLTEQEAKALRLIDNRIAETGYDIDLLKMDIETLEVDLKPFNVSFDELIPLEEKEVVEDDGGAEASDELTEKWGVKTGQIWQLGNHRVMCGDSTNAEQVARLMDKAPVDMIWTDPPYGFNYIKKSDGASIANDGPEFEKIISTALSLVKIDTAYICGDIKTAAPFLRATSSNLGQPKTCIVWIKPIQHRMHRYEPCHELIWFWGDNGSPFYGANIFEAKREIEKFHPTVKPIELIAYCLGSHHDKKIVFDPFSGSGSTFIACEQLDRRCFGMEISPQYVAVIIDRWATFTGKTPELIDNGEA